MSKKCPWDLAAKRALRVEMARRDINYPELAALLAVDGYVVTVQSIRSKLSRGTFSAGFLLRALDAIGCIHLDVQKQK